MNELTWIIIGLGALFILIGITWGRAENKANKYKEQLENLRKGLDISQIIIREANIKGVPPKDLPEDFDKE